MDGKQATKPVREVMLELGEGGAGAATGESIKLPLALADVFYVRSLIPGASETYDVLLDSLTWKKKQFENRATSLYGDEGVEYAYGPKYGEYSKEDRTPLAWTPGLLAIKDRVEDAVNSIDAAHYSGEGQQASDGGRIRFNVCLCNFYRTGKEGIGFHADKEEVGAATPIASISLGCERKFLFTLQQHAAQAEGGEEDRTRYGIQLESGSLLVMWKQCQQNYLHSIPKDRTATEGRINLTFRYLAPRSGV